MASHFEKLGIIGEGFFNLIFPPLCVFCRRLPEKNQRRFLICRACLKKYLIFKTLFCASCGARLPDNKKNCHQENQYRLGAPAHYSDPIVRRVIQELKYGKTEAVARALAALLTAYINELEITVRDYLIVPVPLHSARLRHRGYNQSELLARYLGENIGLGLASGAVKRDRPTKTQTNIKHAEARRENVAGCFIAVRPELINGKNIILVDDIATTGATLAELTRALKQSGAKDIIGLVAAKAR